MRNFDLNWLKDPTVFAVNRLPSHTHFNVEENQFNKKTSLNGIWWFNYSTSPQNVNWDFSNDDFDCTGFDKIKVPAQIQIEGYDTPRYTNVMYPWDGVEEIEYPNIPTLFNPVGQYVKMVEIDELSERTFLSFQGVETAFSLWINGEFVGYSEDSYTPSDFEITEFLRVGKNKIAVAVFKFSTGSWLEDQDFWRMSGIMRDVFLYTTPNTRIKDFYYHTDVNPSNKSAAVDFTINLENANSCDLIEYILLDSKKNVIETQTVVANDMVKIESNLSDLSLWSAETPTLYTVHLLLKVDENILQEILYEVGFKRSEIIDGIWYINGKRLVINGVNRHDSSHLNGRSVTRDEMLWDILQMKRHNVNAVRTCHYPSQNYIYELCNHFGIYVMDETNLETHGTCMPKIEDFDMNIPGNKPEWKDISVDRTNSMFQRDKNLACIISWSLGNESNGGENFRHMKQAIRDNDAVTPVHYECVWRSEKYSDVSDLMSSMYTNAEEISTQLENRLNQPRMLCEYSHAMGNSCGGMHKYIELTEKYEQYQGGFIWDYIDQAILTKDCYGKEFLGFGGDFGDQPNDHNFCINGLIFGDRTLSPKMQLVKTMYQPAKITVDKTKVTIWNKNLFVNLNKYDGICTVMHNGEEVLYKEIEFDVPALETKAFELPIEEYFQGGEYVVTVSLLLKENTLWEDAGYEVMFGQYSYKVEESPVVHRGDLRVVNTINNIGIYGDNFSCFFSTLKGLKSYKIGDKELITSGAKLNFWRAPTDNDIGNKMSYDLAMWKTAGLYAKIINVDFTKAENSAIIKYTYSLPTFIETTTDVIYEIFGDGTIDISMKYFGKKGLPMMPEFSLMIGFDRDLEVISWYGYGEDDSYQDTMQGAKLGVFTSTVDESLKPYVIPQESGNKYGVRWFVVTNERGEGVHIATQTPLEISALPYTPHQIEAFDHPNKLPDIYETILRISKYKMGIGGDDSWGAAVHKEYCISAENDMEFTFSISPN